MLSMIISQQPTREYGNGHNEARFAVKAPSIFCTLQTEYNVDANRLRGIPV